MVDIEHIRQLIQMMVDNDLVELSHRSGDEELRLRRPSPGDPERTAGTSPTTANVSTASAPNAGSSQEDAAGLSEESPSSDRDLTRIVSPMVGTFFAATAPDAPPFVTVGAEINPDTVVCVVEAMKVFNEIKAEISGIVEKIYATNKQAVEFGQPLFGIRRS